MEKSQINSFLVVTKGSNKKTFPLKESLIKRIKNSFYEFYGLPWDKDDLPAILLGVAQGLIIAGAFFV